MFERGGGVEPRLHREIEIRIDGRPPTPNARRHWHKIADDNAKWKKLARQAANEALGAWDRRHDEAWQALERATIDIVFVVGTKARRDLDNLVATLKPLLDGIVDAKVIVDDSTDVLPAFGIRVEYRKGETACEFTIAEPIE